MAAMRNASSGPIGALMSAVVRASPLLVVDALSSIAFFSEGFFSTWLMTPPVEPRPNSIDDGPIRTSIDSREIGIAHV